MGYRAAIIGLGVVGRAQQCLFGRMVHAAYDVLDDGPYPFERVAECDFTVICVGTPQGDDGRADLSAVREALSRIPPEMPVLIRSTIPPGTMAGLEKARACVAHLPEFMNERHDGLWRASGDVPFAILGGTPEAHDFFIPVLAKAIPGPHWILYCCTSLEAELVKYTANAFLAAKVTFVNEMARVCEAFGADWEKVREGWLQDPRVGVSHTMVEGRGGFAGRCLPKDLTALIAAAEDAGYPPGFLRAVRRANEQFRVTQPASFRVEEVPPAGSRGPGGLT
jgi:nucleotide sugar dehydrogenase